MVIMSTMYCGTVLCRNRIHRPAVVWLDDLHQEAEASRRALIGSARGHGGRRRAGAARWHSCHSC